MNDESTPPGQQRSWLGRLSHAFSGEADSIEKLIEELREGHRRGLIDADTMAMIEGSVQVSEMQVVDVMVPRSQVVWIAVDDSLEEILPIIIESGHSRFPVHGDDRDDVVGVLLAKDLLQCFADPQQPRELGRLLRPAVLIPESKRLNVLLKEFRDGRNHMAVVVDEYGAVSGLVTIEDVLEQIVGEIDDEHDEDDGMEPCIEALSADLYRVDALVTVEEFNEFFKTRFSDEEVDTIGGIVVAAAGQVPSPGDVFNLAGWKFVVTGADARRIHRFEVSPAVAADDETESTH